MLENKVQKKIKWGQHGACDLSTIEYERPRRDKVSDRQEECILWHRLIELSNFTVCAFFFLPEVLIE